jgi:selenocysteine-specific elongation factor
VLDVAPPRRGGPHRVDALVVRAAARREELPGLLAAERLAVPTDEVELLVGAPAPSELRAGDWCVHPSLREAVARAVAAELDGFHRANPLEDGEPLDRVRAAVGGVLRGERASTDPSLVDALLDALAASGAVVRHDAALRLPTHRVALDDRSDEVERLLGAVSGEHEAAPPTIKELVAAGFERDVIDAAARAGVVVRLSPELIVAPSLVDRAEATIAAAGAGMTVSGLREALGTSRKYAVPLVEWLDRAGRTRRDGDLRFLRG